MPTEDSSDWRDPRTASLTDQQLLAVMTSLVNLGVGLSPLCKKLLCFYIIQIFMLFPFFQFLRDAVPLKSQRRGCVLIWIDRSCTRTLNRLPTHQRSSRDLSQGFVLACHDYVASGLPLHSISVSGDSPCLRTRLLATIKIVLSGILLHIVIVPGFHRNLPQFFREDNMSVHPHNTPVDLSFLDD